MTVLTPFIGRAKPVGNVIHASGVFSSHRSVVNLDGEDRKIKKQLVNCMKEIQESMKASKVKTEEKKT
ncbi:MAG TPA: hypothetical protein VNK03_02105 [Gammaproteobacteria bacterium]|nr:hypothetical protein [Gammaproteobacteria bacterium]